MNDQTIALMFLSFALAFSVPVVQRSYAYTQNLKAKRQVEEQISAAISAKLRKHLAQMDSEEEGSLSQQLIKQKYNREVNKLLSMRATT